MHLHIIHVITTEHKAFKFYDAIFLYQYKFNYVYEKQSLLIYSDINLSKIILPYRQRKVIFTTLTVSQ